MIKIVGDKNFKHYFALLAQYPDEIQIELGFKKERSSKPDFTKPKGIEFAFAAIWDGVPYAWFGLKKMEMADKKTERYVLFAPMLIASNYEITQLMENKIREEAQKRGVEELLHIGLMPQAAASFGFSPTTYKDLEGQLTWCLECKRRAKTHCQPMIMRI